MTKRYLVPAGVAPWGVTSSSSPIDSLQRRVSRMFDDVFSGFELGSTLENGGKFSPRITLAENEQRYQVTAELPGMSENDIDISLSKDGLILKGEKKEEREGKEDGSYYSERTYGSFMRSFPLTAEIDADKVEANFSKGVLTITLPKAMSAQKQARKISVKAS